ncbi:MAG: QueT transporter family protein [Oscillospiraceae bacterium]|nr:QueT transporter family protein [Oscillospiraceae bacterium]
MNKRVLSLTRAAVIAAAYVALSLISASLGIAFGPVQARLSEALCVLPFLVPEAVGGLFVGCLVTNILSPYGPLDLVVGSLATLLAALATRRCRLRVLAPLPPALFNGVMVGALISFYEVGFTDAFAAAFALNFASVASEEALVCYAFGLPLLGALEKRGIGRK